MYAPATPLPAAPLVPVGIASTAPNPTDPVPLHTELKAHRFELNVLASQRTNVTGALLEGRRPAGAGQLVALQALGRRGWWTLARAHTGARGRFRLSYVPRRLGSRWLRLRFAGGSTALGTRRRLGKLNVYRLAEASWYGGGGSLACGGSLTSSTMGVANKTLPCGTLVTLHYDGRTVRVPVVDRGPYVAGREFDLTEATKDALGFGGVGEVWSTS
ncbi:MAG TPA: septal ring lytic transglycosylase RlpA family protein [Solirubrobacteraceae bacterium]|jgi:rare lipoprotein A|nr:septal ring lytic transglycosylase RlpA family protein [Solirubrobacteraceae bacterium]